MQKSKLLMLLVGLLLVCAPALATKISGRSSTVFEWYDTPAGNTATPIYQYLMLSAKDLGAKGYNFYGYGRLATDMSDEDDVDSRLYSAYLDKYWPLQKIHVRLGRQFFSNTAGASVMDGIRFIYDDIASLPVRLILYGGGDVQFDESYNAGDWVAGGELRYGSAAGADFGLSYLQKRDESDIAYELIGLDAYYDFRRMLESYGELQFDLLTESTSYALLGFNYHRDPRWTLRTEYLYSLPVFSSTSIYSVFAVSEYQELMAEFNYYVQRDIRSYARLQYEIYQEFSNATVLEAGVEKLLGNKWEGYFLGTLRFDGDGQDLYGFKTHGAYWFRPKIRGGLGLHVDVLERDIQDDDLTTSSRIWIDGQYNFTPAVNLQAKVEYLESKVWDYHYRGRIRLNWMF